MALTVMISRLKILSGYTIDMGTVCLLPYYDRLCVICSQQVILQLSLVLGEPSVLVHWVSVVQLVFVGTPGPAQGIGKPTNPAMSTSSRTWNTSASGSQNVGRIPILESEKTRTMTVESPISPPTKRPPMLECPHSTTDIPQWLEPIKSSDRR